MFENSMVALMIMLLLCFVGMLVMFLFVIKSNTVLTNSVKELLKQQQLALGDIERHLLEISYKLRDESDEEKEDNTAPEFNPMDFMDNSPLQDNANIHPSGEDGDLPGTLPDLSLPRDPLAGMR